jgi:hypothetical protein
MDLKTTKEDIPVGLDSRSIALFVDSKLGTFGGVFDVPRANGFPVVIVGALGEVDRVG